MPAVAGGTGFFHVKNRHSFVATHGMGIVCTNTSHSFWTVTLEALENDEPNYRYVGPELGRGPIFPQDQRSKLSKSDSSRGDSASGEPASRRPSL
jgi:hypothetical protein